MVNGCVTVAFLTNGGAGSLLMHANFIKHFRDHFPQKYIKVAVFGHALQELNDAVFKDQYYVDEYFNHSERTRSFAYDVCINTHFYPEVIYESEQVREIAPELHNLLNTWRNFLHGDKSRKYCATHPHEDFNAYLFAILNNRNCLNAGDIDGRLGISKDFNLDLKLFKNEDEVLLRYGLNKYRFITIQRGATPSLSITELPKMWPLEYYNELVRLLKILFPDVKIVQLGESPERSKRIQGVDIELIGKTDWEDLKVLLKNAWLHIDGECGMVHFRRALKAGPSVVLFGPTPMDFYGYEKNINLRTNKCEHWCARLTDTWQNRCLKGETPECMFSLTPRRVLDNILLWDKLNQLQGDKAKKQDIQAKLKLLLSIENIRIDTEYFSNYMSKWYLYHYEIVEVRLKDLSASVMTPDGFKKLPLSETPACQMLKGDEEKYEDYIRLLKLNNNDMMHSTERFKSLIKNINKEGYDTANIIIVDADNHISDGQHRAAWLMNRFGEEHKVAVLKVYFLSNMFPFWRIEKGSRVILYGFGSFGQNYAKQILNTNYLDILFAVDKNYFLYNNEIVTCYPPEKIMESKGLYDYIIIAVDSDKWAAEIMKKLLDMKVDINKIICKCNIAVGKPQLAERGAT